MKDGSVPKSKQQPSVEMQYLRYLAQTGLNERYHDKPPIVAIDRLAHELDVIEKAEYATYFLIVWDLCRYCREVDLPIGPGRGSVCGSIMAWAIRITDVNPLTYDIPFERFMHLDRVVMPDIDLDVCQRRRQEVINYLKDKYGDDHVAQIVTFGTLTAKTAVLDTCRVLHVDEYIYGNGASNRYGLELSAMVPEGSGPDQIFLKPFIEKNPDFAQKLRAPQIKYNNRKLDLVQHLLTLEGQPRHVSKHAAGVIISPTPLFDMLPMRSKSDEDPTTQFDMHDLERMGYLKMDCLGLRNVTLLHDIEKAAEIQFRHTAMNDEETFDLIERGDTVGVFQLEGAGITSAATGLKARTFKDVCALIALYRPGPMEQLGAFIGRAHGEERVSYLHPDLKSILKDTYGLIIYQEQVMRMAQVFAGYTPGEADLFRKAIGKKDDKLIRQQLEEFKERALDRGYDKGVVQAIVDQVFDFGRYGFNIGHSVGYGHITYWTAYAKAHYPKEFFTALLNSYVGDVERMGTVLRDVSRHGIRVLPPSINGAGLDFTSHPVADTILFALSAVKGIGDKSADLILTEREDNGPFKSFSDFCSRMPRIPINVKMALIDAGAFERDLTKRGVLLHDAPRLNAEAKRERTPTLKSAVDYDLPDFEMAERERKATGFYLSGHPLKLRMPQLDIYELDTELQATGAMAAIIVSAHTHTSKRGEMAFLAVESLVDGCPDLTVFSDVWEASKHFCQPGRFILFGYKKQEYRGKMGLIVDRLYEMTGNVFPASSATLRLTHVSKEYARQLAILARAHPGTVPLRFDIPFWEGKRAVLRCKEISIATTAAAVDDFKKYGYFKLAI